MVSHSDPAGETCKSHDPSGQSGTTLFEKYKHNHGHQDHLESDTTEYRQFIEDIDDTLYTKIAVQS